MTEAEAVLALIPARAGSKGLPGKNTRVIGGRPLLAHAVECARRSGVVGRIVLSTDAEEIAAVGREWGAEVPFLRPADLAGDATPMLPVVQHAVDELSARGWQPDIVLLLQPTSPLRRPEHLARAVAMLRETGADSVVSVVELPRHLSPDYVMRIDEGCLVPFLPSGAGLTRRQDARRAYVRDGTIYAFWRRTLTTYQGIYGARCLPLTIPAFESVTIDSAEDWVEAERRMIEAPWA